MPREIKKIGNVKCSYNQKNWNVDNIVNDVSGVLYTSAYYSKKKFNIKTVDCWMNDHSVALRSVIQIIRKIIIICVNLRAW